MADELQLEVKLLSDATFGRGDGVVGLIDTEVEHDEFGLPYLRGRTIKGLLVEECANVLYALSGHPSFNILEQIASHMFGGGGSTALEMGLLKVGAGKLPKKFCAAIRDEIWNGKLTREEVLTAMTAIRRQTAISAQTGAPLKNSLRSMRVVLRDTTFTSPLTLEDGLDTKLATTLLAACAAAVRRGGIGRNRGRGRLACRLLDRTGNNLMPISLAEFRQLITPRIQTEGEAA